MSVARLRLAPVGETMFPPRAPFLQPVVGEPSGSPTPPPTSTRSSGKGCPMSVARLRLAPVGETMFPPRAPFFQPDVGEPSGSPTPLHTLIGQGLPDERRAPPLDGQRGRRGDAPGDGGRSDRDRDGRGRRRRSRPGRGQGERDGRLVRRHEEPLPALRREPRPRHADLGGRLRRCRRRRRRGGPAAGRRRDVGRLHRRSPSTRSTTRPGRCRTCSAARRGCR